MLVYMYLDFGSWSMQQLLHLSPSLQNHVSAFSDPWRDTNFFFFSSSTIGNQNQTVPEHWLSRWNQCFFLNVNL